MKKIIFNAIVIIIFYVMIVTTESIVQNQLVLWDESYIHLLIIMTITLTLLFIFDNKKIDK